MTQQSKIRVEMSSDQAWCLARFLKRITWDGIRFASASDAEAENTREAIRVLERELADAGIKPR